MFYLFFPYSLSFVFVCFLFCFFVLFCFGGFVFCLGFVFNFGVCYFGALFSATGAALKNTQKQTTKKPKETKRPGYKKCKPKLFPGGVAGVGGRGRDASFLYCFPQAWQWTNCVVWGQSINLALLDSGLSDYPQLLDTKESKLKNKIEETTFSQLCPSALP